MFKSVRILRMFAVGQVQMCCVCVISHRSQRSPSQQHMPLLCWSTRFLCKMPSSAMSLHTVMELLNFSSTQTCMFDLTPNRCAHSGHWWSRSPPCTVLKCMCSINQHHAHLHVYFLAEAFVTFGALVIVIALPAVHCPHVHQPFNPDTATTAASPACLTCC